MTNASHPQMQQYPSNWRRWHTCQHRSNYQNDWRLQEQESRPQTDDREIQCDEPKSDELARRTLDALKIENEKLQNELLKVLAAKQLVSASVYRINTRSCQTDGADVEDASTDAERPGVRSQGMQTEVLVRHFGTATARSVRSFFRSSPEARRYSGRSRRRAQEN